MSDVATPCSPWPHLFFFVFWWAPVAFRRVVLETPEWTSRGSNHHRQSVSAGKTNAIPTEPSGRLVALGHIGWNLVQGDFRSLLLGERFKKHSSSLSKQLPVCTRFNLHSQSGCPARCSAFSAHGAIGLCSGRWLQDGMESLSALNGVSIVRTAPSTCTTASSGPFSTAR